VSRLATLLLPALAALLLSSSPALAARVRPRIVHGAPTAIDEAPFQVALYDPQVVDSHEPDNLLEAQFCGGVIRDATHVLTAAHCVTFGGFEAAAPEEIEVLAGSANLQEPEVGSIEDPVVATSFDPDFDPFTYEHDLGVLTLEKPLWEEGTTPEIGGAGVRIAPIALAGGFPAIGSSATVSGWGFTKPLLPEQEPTEAEEEEGHPALLQSAQVTTLLPAECASDYEEESLLRADFICAIGSGSPTTDACYGDSGGPLFSGPLGDPEDRLLALVDFGAGCAQKEFPGVYQSVVTGENRLFATSNPPQAPRNTAEPTIDGEAAVGQTLTCEPGSWLGSSEFQYRFYRDESSIAHPFAITALSEQANPWTTYVTRAGDAGTRIFCAVTARNAGGVGEAISDELTIAPLPAPPNLIAAPTLPPAPAPAPSQKPSLPTLRLLAARCRRGVCTVTVRASKGSGDALVTKVEAKLSFTRRLACRKHGRRTTCKRTFARKLAARNAGGGRFSIVAGDLKPGPYTLTLVAIDKLGLRQAHATKVALLLASGGRRR
jgi:trypsin